MLGVRRRESEGAVEKGLEMLMFSGVGGIKRVPRQKTPHHPLPEITLSLSQLSGFCSSADGPLLVLQTAFLLLPEERKSN